MRALFSVYDKSGLAAFARGLHALGVELIASGGTAHFIWEAGIPVTSVEDYTGFAPILNGRVKTLHPAIYAGILARDDEQGRASLDGQGWGLIDLVAVNLYPFTETVARVRVRDEEAVDQIDIGGAALIRAAAKNHERVTVLTSPADYGPVLAALQEAETLPFEMRRALALKAFQHTAAYDLAIQNYFAGEEDGLPGTLGLMLSAKHSLRYGENPHQSAALYTGPGVQPLGAEQLQGKALSYNNLLDLDAAWTAVEDFDAPTIVIVKHLSPCGIASGDDFPATFRAALASDPVSAFGGVIACNRSLDGPTVGALGDLFIEAIAAPDFTPDALAVLSSRSNCRLLKMKPLNTGNFAMRTVRGGVLVQTPDQGQESEWKVVTERSPTEAEERALRFAWKAVRHVRSNAIVFAHDGATVGIGGGLPSRIDAVRLAANKAGEAAQGAVMASDAFFPFPDGIEAAAAAGVRALIQPGGSVRDDAVIKAANRLGLAMVLTGVRHFRH